MDERTATVNIGGQEYEMLLTTRATKAIAGRYGGLENLGEKLMKAENFEMALDEIVWLITLLCNHCGSNPADHYKHHQCPCREHR